ncbi:helix-turn-helix domain-containing protein [Streptomyces sp. SPB074]|uniref:helix-turn-helix domain-containing protein n=1 Tax=Streptomyces sp. (strain SPB074) TaxID=465543 RepID=UPI00017F1904|nr:helix-turn-helix transcriptional regulator [Streptomyces sp. SPB074]EDY42273.1 AraC family transcriptional regulator [Streptomyces sp. SPB074]
MRGGAAALPHPRLRPGVLRYHGYRLTVSRPRLEVPVGAVTLVLGFGAPVRVTAPGQEATTLVSLIGGLTTLPAVGEHLGVGAGVEVLVAPWTAFRLLGVEQHALARRCTDPGALPGGERWHRLAEALAELPDWPARFALLDRTLPAWLDAGPAWSPRVEYAWRLLERSGGRVPVRRLAAEVGWSERQTQSRFREQIGLTPKAAARVVRLQRAVRLLTSGLGQAETAALCGFYDQAHLSGEFRAMTDRTPGAFTAARAALTANGAAGAAYGPDGEHVRDRLGGAVTSLLL